MAASMPVVIGAVVSQWFKARAKKTKTPNDAEQKGVLVASGLIVGESLFGVALAGVIVATGNEAPLALVPADFAAATAIGIAAFAGLVFALYRWALKTSN
jgi:hypothetical protein